MTPTDAIRFVKQLAESALASGAYKNFATAMQARDAVVELDKCANTQNLFDSGKLVPVDAKPKTDGQQQSTNGPAGD